MATWDEVHRIAMELPETEEQSSQDDHMGWRVKNKLYAWERPLRPADLKALGLDAQEGPVMAAWVPDEGAKQALLADDPDLYFTTAHFNGYPIILVRLEKIGLPELRELLVEAWLARAPKKLATQFLNVEL